MMRRLLESIWVSSIKGSSQFKRILDQFIMDIINRFTPKEDFYCDKYRLYSAKKFKKLLVEEYWYMPVYTRVDKLKQILQSQVKSKKKAMLERVEKFYDARIEKALYKNIDPIYPTRICDKMS